MNAKTAIRLAFDLLVLVVMVLLYNKRAISMAFHEIAGLVLFAFLIIHLLPNRRWISGITSKIAGGTLPARTVFSYAVSVCALLAFILVGISGVALSRVVFDFHSTLPVWKILHKTGAAVALILIGIHLGLHRAFLSSMLSQWFAVPDNARSVLHELRLAKPLVALSAKTRSVLLKIFVVLVLATGAVSFATTPFFRWLSLPFVTRPAARASVPPPPEAGTSRSPAPDPGSGATGRPPRSSGENAPVRAGRPASPAERPAAKTAPRDEKNSLMHWETPAETARAPVPAKRRDKPGLVTSLKTLGQFISMTLSIAILTAMADTGLTALRKKRR